MLLSVGRPGNACPAILGCRMDVKGCLGQAGYAAMQQRYSLAKSRHERLTPATKSSNRGISDVPRRQRCDSECAGKSAVIGLLSGGGGIAHSRVHPNLPQTAENHDQPSPPAGIRPKSGPEARFPARRGNLFVI